MPRSYPGSTEQTEDPADAPTDTAAAWKRGGGEIRGKTFPCVWAEIVLIMFGLGFRAIDIVPE